MLKGYQGDLSQPFNVAATAKHFIADDATKNGIDRGNAIINMEEIKLKHMPDFIDAIDQGVCAIMASFSSVNGEKVHGPKTILTDLLRTELGFEGVVISDWEGVRESGNSIRQGIEAGIDMFMFAVSWKDSLPQMIDLVKKGVIPMTRIDASVLRILCLKKKLGLFTHPIRPPQPKQTIGSKAHRALARKAVQESLVLLQNKKKILPLHSAQPLLILGSHANNIAYQCGGWTKKWQGAHLDCFQKPARKVDGATSILKGFKSTLENVTTTPQEHPHAKVAIVITGEKPYAEGLGYRSSKDLRLPPINWNWSKTSRTWERKSLSF
jgi:beta-glucosidase